MHYPGLNYIMYISVGRRLHIFIMFIIIHIGLINELKPYPCILLRLLSSGRVRTNIK